MPTAKLNRDNAALRGETFAYWYLRRQGYVFVAWNYMPRGATGEIDLVGYDGEFLTLAEVRNRTVREDQAPRRFVTERHVKSVRSLGRGGDRRDS